MKTRFELSICTPCQVETQNLSMVVLSKFGIQPMYKNSVWTRIIPKHQIYKYSSQSHSKEAVPSNNHTSHTEKDSYTEQVTDKRTERSAGREAHGPHPYTYPFYLLLCS